MSDKKQTYIVSEDLSDDMISEAENTGSFEATSGNKRIVDDFSDVQDKEVIRDGLCRMRRKISVKIILMIILFLSGVYLFAARFARLSFLYPSAILPNANPARYLYITAAVTFLALLLNIVPLFAGIARIFKARITVDGMTLLFGLSVLGYDVYFSFHQDVFASYGRITFDALFILALLLGLIRKRKMVKNLIRGFEIVSDDEPKTVVSKPQNITVGNDVMAEIGIGGDILYASRTEVVKGFVQREFDNMESSAGLDPFRFFIFLALLLVMAAMLPTHRILLPDAIFYLAAGFAFCSPSLCALNYISAVVRLSRKLAEEKTVISGVSGAREVEEAGILVVAESELLSGDNVHLIGKKIFQKDHEKRILSEIRTVLSETGGCLFDFFDGIADGQRLKASEFTGYGKNGYGAVIDGKKCILGSQDLMKKSGVKAPRVEAAPSQHALYYAADGALEAVFLFSYDFPIPSKEGLEILDKRGIATGIAGATMHLTESFYTKDIELNAAENVALLSPGTSRKCAACCGYTHTAQAEIATLHGLRGIAAGFLGLDKTLFNSMVRNTFQIVSALLALVILLLRIFLVIPFGSYIILQICLYQILWNIPLFVVGRSNRV